MPRQKTDRPMETTKALGGVGSILMVISPLVGPGFILGIVGLILVMIALKDLSDRYGQKRIFDDALYGVLILVVGIVVTAVVAALVAMSLLASLGIPWGDWRGLSGINWATVNWMALLPRLGAILVALVVGFVFLVVSSIFFKKVAIAALREVQGKHVRHRGNADIDRRNLDHNRRRPYTHLGFHDSAGHRLLLAQRIINLALLLLARFLLYMNCSPSNLSTCRGGHRAAWRRRTCNTN